MTPPLLTQITPPPGQFDADTPTASVRRTHFVIGLCVLGGACALLVMAAWVVFDWRGSL